MAIDRTKADHWLELLFAKRRPLDTRKEIVEEEVIKAVQTLYPEYIDQLRKQFKLSRKVQDRRNLIAHGLWLPGASDTDFIVQPLNLKDGTAVLDEATRVDIEWLGTLIQDIDLLNKGLSFLVAEMLAHQLLKKWGRR